MLIANVCLLCWRLDYVLRSLWHMRWTQPVTFLLVGIYEPKDSSHTNIYVSRMENICQPWKTHWGGGHTDGPSYHKGLCWHVSLGTIDIYSPIKRNIRPRARSSLWELLRPPEISLFFAECTSPCRETSFWLLVSQKSLGTFCLCVSTWNWSRRHREVLVLFAY